MQELSLSRLTSRVKTLEEASQHVELRLPREKKEAEEWLERIRREQLTRIAANPLPFRDRLAKILKQLEPWQRQVIASAFTREEVGASDDIGDPPDTIS
jgi:hypothetical protein